MIESELALELLVVQLDLHLSRARRASRSGWVSTGKFESQESVGCS